MAGEPRTTSVVYYPPLLVVMLVLATVAGVLAVVGVARLRRAAGRAGPVSGETEFPVAQRAS